MAVILTFFLPIFLSNQFKKTTKAKSTKSKSRKNANKAALKDNNIIVVKESVSGSEDDFIPEKNGDSHKIWPFVAGFTLLFVNSDDFGFEDKEEGLHHVYAEELINWL